MTVNKKEEYIVKKVTKKNRKYVVEFTEELELTVTEDQIVEFRIVKDKVFSASDIEEIKNSQNLSNFYNKALNYINFKPRTLKEVLDYLKKYELSEEQIEYIIQRLIDIDFINDERYVKSYILECSRKAKGKQYVIQKLTSKGIEKEQILSYLYLYNNDQELDNAINLAIKYSKTITKFPIKKQQLQISNKLLLSGFSYDIVNKVLSQIELTDDSHETLLKDYDKLKTKTNDKNEIIQKLLAKGYHYSDILEIIR